MVEGRVATYHGKVVFGILVLVVIVLAALTGLIVGTSPDIHAISVFGVVLFRPTPLSMAVYGVVGAVVVLGTIFGIVSFLSRFDEDAVES